MIDLAVFGKSRNQLRSQMAFTPLRNFHPPVDENCHVGIQNSIHDQAKKVREMLQPPHRNLCVNTSVIV